MKANQFLQQAAHAERWARLIDAQLIRMGAVRFHDEYVIELEAGVARRNAKALNLDSPLLPPPSDL